jgi:hypothetical protein
MSQTIAPAELPGWLAAGAAGDVEALARVYALAACYMRAGEALPPDLAAFVAGALQAASGALLNHSTETLPGALAQALHARRKGTPGRKPKQRTPGYARLLASNVAQLVAGGMGADAACHHVADNPGPTCNPRRHLFKDVQAAWLAYRHELMPEPEKK